MKTLTQIVQELISEVPKVPEHKQWLADRIENDPAVVMLAAHFAAVGTDIINNPLSSPQQVNTAIATSILWHTIIWEKANEIFNDQLKTKP